MRRPRPALKRTELVSTYRGKWAEVSGGIEAAMPIDQAYREAREETGLGGHVC